MNRRRLIPVGFLLAALGLAAADRTFSQDQPIKAEPVRMEGLRAAVRVVRDSNYIPHIFARNDHDAFLMLGYIHAQDRLFQMDMQRRMFSGQLAELFGKQALNSDLRIRPYGLRRAAQASLNLYSPEMKEIFNAYAQGVNAHLAQVKKHTDMLPPEYSTLELTAASIPAWTPLDTVIIAKGMALQFSFDLIDAGVTKNLATYEQAGKDGGFDGRKLFFEDVFRLAPFDTSVSQPSEENSKFLLNREKLNGATLKRSPTIFVGTSNADLLSPFDSSQPDSQSRKEAFEAGANESAIINSETMEMVSDYLASAEQVPFLRQFLNRDEAAAGSNWWVVSGKHTASGYPVMANDPHLSLSMAPVFYEVHLSVEKDPKNGAMNVNGVSFAGMPSILLGCNDQLCWGSTVNPMDVTDIYREQLVDDSRTVFGATIFEGKKEPLIVIEEKYNVNKIGDATQDNLELANVKPTEGGLTWIVPRRNNGPIIEFKRLGLASVGLSVQYTGWLATRELESFYRWGRARNMEDFKDGLKFYDVGSQNWAVADIKGNIAYFAGAKVPLREDLQTLGRADGDIPPFLIRDGTRKLKHEWLKAPGSSSGRMSDFQTLPFDEMPGLINPAQGFIASANNDPVGTSIDNNPVNQYRKDGGVYYLNLAYHTGMRMGRILEILRDAIAGGKKISLSDMMRFQADNQLLDAEILTPYILKAFDNARASDAAAPLAKLAQDAGIAEAVSRFRNWDYSTPTGIIEGYDPGDDPARLAEPSTKEIQSSVSATIYCIWRGRVIENTIDATLRRLGLGNLRPANGSSMSALRRLLENFPTTHGRGVSGINFFELKSVDSPEAARDLIILTSLQDALKLLSSDAFAAAFGKSTNQGDYRWGRLHRLALNHMLGTRFSLPGAAGFAPLSPALPGIARPGGFEAMDGSSHNVRAATANAFMSGSGSARRFVCEMTPQGPKAFQIIPGGQSGDARSPFYSNMLGRWLTNQYHPMLLTKKQVDADRLSEQRFEPAR